MLFLILFDVAKVPERYGPQRRRKMWKYKLKAWIALAYRRACLEEDVERALF